MPNQTTKEVLIRLSSSIRQPAQCRGCSGDIVWMQTLTGKRMPMNAGAIVRHESDGVQTFSASDSHWATCPARDQFKRKR